ncbi:MAG TPA: tetratricopeptide repeat protein [Lacibacter sp.]|nr:tetratricopeptide repeat protein [Lacibacter sp.]
MRCFILFLPAILLMYQASAQSTFCGNKTYPALSFTAAATSKLEADITNAYNNFIKDTTNADALIWYGRRLAYMGKYDEAIALFSKGVQQHPTDARMYRHRGHRYLTTRCFDKAIADFTKAAELIKGKPDDVEPDGMPNAQNIPTSTLHSNIWYHLGLAYYITGQFEKAEIAYRQCLNVSANPDMYVAAANWYYITLRELKKENEAAELLNTIHKDMKLIENDGYLTILLLYKQQQNPAVLYQELMNNNNTLTNATAGFGLGNFYRLSGNTAQAQLIFEQVVKGSQWGSFAFMAAESLLQKKRTR